MMPLTEFLSTKDDLEFFEEFKDKVIALMIAEHLATERVENESGGMSPVLRDRQMLQEARQVVAAENDETYIDLRDEVARGLPRAKAIAHSEGIPIHLKSYPPPAVGGVVIPINLLDAVLHDNSHGGIGPTEIRDALMQTMGSLELRLRRARRRLFNPLGWIAALLTWIIRIPFRLAQASGFEVAKIEDHLLSRLFKLLTLMALVVFLLYVGFTVTDLKEIVGKLLGK